MHFLKYCCGSIAVLSLPAVDIGTWSDKATCLALGTSCLVWHFFTSVVLYCCLTSVRLSPSPVFVPPVPAHGVQSMLRECEAALFSPVAPVLRLHCVDGEPSSCLVLNPSLSCILTSGWGQQIPPKCRHGVYQTTGCYVTHDRNFLLKLFTMKKHGTGRSQVHLGGIFIPISPHLRHCAGHVHRFLWNTDVHRCVCYSHSSTGWSLCSLQPQCHGLIAVFATATVSRVVFQQMYWDQKFRHSPSWSGQYRNVLWRHMFRMWDRIRVQIWLVTPVKMWQSLNILER
jgi:hypothetical protein